MPLNFYLKLFLNVLIDLFYDTLSSKIREKLDCTKNKTYYKSAIIKWRGSSVG